MEPRDIEYIPISRLLVDSNVQRERSEHRVTRIADNFSEDALGTVTVSRRANGSYHIIDGQHRTEAARLARGESFPMPCRVFHGLSIEAEARMFRLLNDTVKVDALPLFHVRVVEGESVAVHIAGIADENGWKIATRTSGAAGYLHCVAALERLYRRDPEALSKALATVIRAWGTEPPSGDGRLIEGIGLVYHRYGTAVDVSELVPKLAGYPGGPGKLLGAARGLRELIRGVSLIQGVAEIVVEVYNKSRRTRALPSWRSA